jgi:hypothetical protein
VAKFGFKRIADEAGGWGQSSGVGYCNGISACGHGVAISVSRADKASKTPLNAKARLYKQGRTCIHSVSALHDFETQISVQSRFRASYNFSENIKRMWAHGSHPNGFTI